MRVTRPIARTFFASLTIAAGLIFAPSANAGTKLNVVASFSILGDMVTQVGGDLVQVTTLVGPNADAHIFQPSPADALAIRDAQLIVSNGLGFEGWMDRLVQAAGAKGEIVIASNGVAPLKMTEDGQQIIDPHAFQSLKNGLIYVQNIAEGLCRADAGNCPAFQRNAKAYSDEITALDRDVTARFAAVPEQRRTVITSHDAFGYLAAAYGLTFVAPQGFSTESEASAADVGRLITQIRASAAKALFIENMSDPRLIEQIARETGVAIGGALYADALSKADEPAPTYLALFRHNAGLLTKAMLGS
jgi:zinc/manganese transport system substrate-binding protein